MNQRPKIVSKVEIVQDESLLDCSESPVVSAKIDSSLCGEEIDIDDDQIEIIMGTPKKMKLQRMFSHELAIKDTPEIQHDADIGKTKEKAVS